MMLSERVRQIGFSPTLAVSDLAARMRAEGVDVLDFSAGQPDFDTPERVKDAARRAIDENRTRYTAAAGMPQLREAIAHRIASDLDLTYEPNQIVVSPGAKASLYFAFLSLLNDGDEVLVPTPYWTSYPEQIKLAGADAVFLECDEACGFKLQADQIRKAVTPRTRALLLNYPSNPTGACYDRAELQALAAACVEHDLWIVADEIYSKLLYDGRRFVSVAQLGQEIRDRTLLIDGMSKTYAMTGWRIGYTAGPVELISAMGKLQSHSTSNATTIAQWASVEALSMTDEELAPRRNEFEKRRTRIVERLRAIEGVSCVEPAGAFYAFPDFSRRFTGPDAKVPIQSGADMARYLLEESSVAVVPGEAFGAPRNLRLSYACSLAQVEEGMDRIERALEKLPAAP
jgi:aspartate aminotransferase